MSAYIPVKMTEAERDLLDWIQFTTGAVSRSGVLRSAMNDLARRLGAPGDLMRRVNLARLTSQPRASKAVARRRLHGDDAPTPAVGNT